MKKALFALMCLAAMLAAGTGLKAREVTITLYPGWTWISYIGTEPQDFSTALGSFTPAVGDRIKSQWGNAIYGANGMWRGPVTQFYPGYGYMYYSARIVPVSVTFNGQPPLQVVVTTADPTAITTYLIKSIKGGLLFLRGRLFYRFRQESVFSFLCEQGLSSPACVRVVFSGLWRHAGTLKG